MPTQEERLATLERKVASLELELLYEQRKAEESTPSERAYNLNEVNHHLTMLLGIASGQERDMKIIKAAFSKYNICTRTAWATSIWIGSAKS